MTSKNTSPALVLGSTVTYVDVYGNRKGTVVGISNGTDLALIDFGPGFKGHDGDTGPISNQTLLEGFDPKGKTSLWFVWPHEVKVVDLGPIAPREPSAPMTKAVLELMRRKGAITQMEAQGVLRCRALPRRISDLRELGHRIVRELKEDHTGQRYARYHLEAVAA